VFNNAGAPAPVGGIETTPVEAFDQAMATLVRSVMLGMKHVAPLMMQQRSGSIINNGSVAGVRAGYTTSITYAAAKAAVVHLTTCVAMQLGESNVRVNCISPGGIATGIFGKALGLPLEAAEKSAEAMKAGLEKYQPIPRAGLHQWPQSGGGRRAGRRAAVVGRAEGLSGNSPGVRHQVARRPGHIIVRCSAKKPPSARLPRSSPRSAPAGS
jgi:NAD(P)-dependent dehydrogenase (short-subunit alcohol dehydrogenase family)